MRRQIREFSSKLASNEKLQISAPRGRSDGRQDVNKQSVSQSRSRSRSANVRFRAKMPSPPTKKPGSSPALLGRSPATLPSAPRTQVRTLEVSKKAGSNTKCNLPRSKLPLANSRAMIVLRDTDVSCQELHNYLKTHSIAANSACTLKEKSRKYRTYVIECNEAFMEPLFDEELWHPGMLVKEFIGFSNPNNVHSSFPEGGNPPPPRPKNDNVFSNRSINSNNTIKNRGAPALGAPKSLNCIYFNARSAAKHGAIDAFSSYCDHHRIPIVLLSETWFTAAIRDAELTLKNSFNVTRLDRPSRGGGVCILTRWDVPISPVASNLPGEFVAIDIQSDTHRLRIACCYVTNAGEAHARLQRAQLNAQMFLMICAQSITLLSF